MSKESASCNILILQNHITNKEASYDTITLLIDNNLHMRKQRRRSASR